MKDLKLYEVTTKTGRKKWYVVAEHPTEAWSLVSNILKTKDYGFTEERTLSTISLIATMNIYDVSVLALPLSLE